MEPAGVNVFTWPAPSVAVIVNVRPLLSIWSPVNEYPSRWLPSGDIVAASPPFTDMRTVVSSPLSATFAADEHLIVVLDASDRVVHRQLVPEITQEPDYDAALAAL